MIPALVIVSGEWLWIGLPSNRTLPSVTSPFSGLRSPDMAFRSSSCRTIAPEQRDDLSGVRRKARPLEDLVTSE